MGFFKDVGWFIGETAKGVVDDTCLPHTSEGQKGAACNAHDFSSGSFQLHLQFIVLVVLQFAVL